MDTDTHTLQKIRYLDEQLSATELSEAEQELTSRHRLGMLQQRSEAMKELGPRPIDGDASGWERQRDEIEQSLALQAQTERLQTEGLEAAWKAFEHRDRLEKTRGELVVLLSDHNASPAGAIQPALSEAMAQQQPHHQQQQALDEPELPQAELQQQQQQHVQQQQHQQQQQAAAASVPQQWPVGAWDAGAADGDQEHVEVMALDLNTNPGYDANASAYAPAAAAATPPQPLAQAPAATQQPVPEGSKLCRRCHTVKPCTDFYKSKANSDGYDGRCKVCDAQQCIDRRRKKQRIDVPTVSQKACHKCVIIKPAGDFYRNRTNRDGLYNNCKKCFADNSARRQQHLPPMEQRMAEQKKCRRCEQVKPATEFYKNRLMLDGLYSHCKTCYQQSAANRAAARHPVDIKACRRCNITKASSEFYKSKMTSDGLQSYCKHCYKITAAQTRVKKLEEEQANAEAGRQNAALFQAPHEVLVPPPEAQQPPPQQGLAQEQLQLHQQQHEAAQQQQQQQQGQQGHPQQAMSQHQQALPQQVLPQEQHQHQQGVHVSETGAAAAAASAMGLPQQGAVPGGEVAPSGDLVDSQARLHSLLEASDGQPPPHALVQPPAMV